MNEDSFQGLINDVMPDVRPIKVEARVDLVKARLPEDTLKAKRAEAVKAEVEEYNRLSGEFSRPGAVTSRRRGAAVTVGPRRRPADGGDRGAARCRTEDARNRPHGPLPVTRRRSTAAAGRSADGLRWPACVQRIGACPIT